MRMTPKEFGLIMKAETESTYDRYQFAADTAMMQEKASRAKRPKITDLFKRPVDEEKARKKTESMVEQTEHTQEWLSQFEIT